MTDEAAGRAAHDERIRAAAAQFAAQLRAKQAAPKDEKPATAARHSSLKHFIWSDDDDYVPLTYREREKIRLAKRSQRLCQPKPRTDNRPNASPPSSLRTTSS